MIKVLFLIHDLGQGGAERVLVNLVNNMDKEKFDITIMSLFDHGENRELLGDHIRYKYWKKHMMRGNSHVMKLLSPERLHNMIVGEHYDVEVAYLEGPCARVIGGCRNRDTKLISWIHTVYETAEKAAAPFRSINEAIECYSKFNRIVCVSESVKEGFGNTINVDAETCVIYNANDIDRIRELSLEGMEEPLREDSEIKLVGAGKLQRNKGFDRMIRIVGRLASESYPVHLYILGDGPEKNVLTQLARQLDIEDRVTFLGYQTNPYKYIAKCDLFLCASYVEGFSTATIEALALGVPVCTVEVGGMKEMLGENNEYGIITANDEKALYQGIKWMLDNPSETNHFKSQAQIRAKEYSLKRSVRNVERMLVAFTEQSVRKHRR